MNDSLIPIERARVSPVDRGLTLGDGLFETIRVSRGRPQLLRRHLARLRCSAELILLTIPWGDEWLVDAIRTTTEANGLQEAAVRLTVTRGEGQRRGLLPAPGTPPTLVIRATPFFGYPASAYDGGFSAIFGRIRRNETSPLSHVKSLSYLENVLSRVEASQAGADEALMLNSKGLLAGGSYTNLYLVADGEVITPSLHCGALAGTVREVLLRLAARVGVPNREAEMLPESLWQAQEVWVSNSLLGVVPLTHLDGQPIGGGRPGKLYRRLNRAFADFLDNEDL